MSIYLTLDEYIRKNSKSALIFCLAAGERGRAKSQKAVFERKGGTGVEL